MIDHPDSFNQKTDKESAAEKRRQHNIKVLKDLNLLNESGSKELPRYLRIMGNVLALPTSKLYFFYIGDELERMLHEDEYSRY